MTFFQKIRSWFTPPRSASDAPVEPAEPVAASASPACTRPMAALIAAVRRCDRVDALSADMAHYSGYVREAALERAEELRAPELLPAIADRLNDWVPRVRQRARDLVLDWLPQLDADAAIRLLGKLQHLRVAGRTDHSAWLQAFEQAVVAHVGVDRIAAEVAGADLILARACFRLLAEHGLVDPATLVRLGQANGTDIVLAHKTAEALARLDPDDRETLGRAALRSPFGMVRATALRILLADGADTHDALAADMIADPNSWVRLVAHSWLERRGIDSGPLFAARLAAPDSAITVLRACLMGLAETGKREYLDLVQRMTAHPSARVRSHAFSAWRQLAPADKDVVAERVLADASRRVRKAVLTMHRKHGAFVPFDVAWRLLRERGDIDLMLRYVESEQWQRLALIVELEPASRTDPLLRERLRHELMAWIDASNSQYTRPRDDQRACFAQPGTKADLLELLGRDDRRAQGLVFNLDNM
jgi:HEAT repeat protein